MEPIFTFVGILLGGGILGFIQFLISRSDSKDEKDNEVLKKLDENKEEINKVQQETQKEIKAVWEFINEENARKMRTHILRFYDEIASGKDHGKDYFDDIIDEIDQYEKYCETHENFPNGRTVHAAKFIVKTYERLVEKGEFAEKDNKE